MWSYSLDNGSPAVQALSANEVVQDTFVAQVSDGHGELANQTITVNVTGTNDAPVVTAGNTVDYPANDGHGDRAGRNRDGYQFGGFQRRLAHSLAREWGHRRGPGHHRERRRR